MLSLLSFLAGAAILIAAFILMRKGNRSRGGTGNWNQDNGWDRSTDDSDNTYDDNWDDGDGGSDD